MADTATATKGDTKPKRPIPTIQDELDQAKARLKALHSKVEQENHLAALKAETLDAVKKQWEQTAKGVPFNPQLLNIDATPYVGDRSLQVEFHGLHYTIARLDNELSAAIKESIQA